MSLPVAEVYDTRICQLGEGPLWHPQRGQLFWFDILNHTLMSRSADGVQMLWPMGEFASAAGWTGPDTLLVATQSALVHLDLVTRTRELVAPLEDNNPVTRSNDGRADPWGGFWIGTMGQNSEPGAGAIYRYYKGNLRKLLDNITISNAICFAADKSCVFCTDTVTRKIMTLPLHPDTGWPEGEATVFLDLSGDGLNPDGAVTDASGSLWVAQWGAARVACHDTDAKLTGTVSLPAAQTTCPAFGGPDLRDLFVTTAATGLGPDALDRHPLSGSTFVIRNAGQGRPEPQVLL